jgi:hypothetical protein
MFPEIIKTGRIMKSLLTVLIILGSLSASAGTCSLKAKAVFACYPTGTSMGPTCGFPISALDKKKIVGVDLQTCMEEAVAYKDSIQDWPNASGLKVRVKYKGEEGKVRATIK